jgi:hypothetical protein
VIDSSPHISFRTSLAIARQDIGRMFGGLGPGPYAEQRHLAGAPQGIDRTPTMAAWQSRQSGQSGRELGRAVVLNVCNGAMRSVTLAMTVSQHR